MGDGNEDQTERIARDMERLLRAMNEEGVAGGMVGPDGLTLGIPNWEERTKHLRPSERVKTHGYPLGFAKGQQALRDGVMERYFGQVSACGGDEAARHQLAHDAVARALDWERFLGSFNHAGEERFPLNTVDLVADHLLAWLHHLGFLVVGTAEGERFVAKRDGVSGIDDAVSRGEDDVLDHQRDELRKSDDEESEKIDGVDDNKNEKEESDEEVELDEANLPEGAELCPMDEDNGRSGCELCGGRGWVTEADFVARLGVNRVPCVNCNGEGFVDGAGPVSWRCRECVGSGRMPVRELKFFDLTQYDLMDQDWSSADLSDQNLSSATFSACDFSNVSFALADLSDTSFDECDFSGAEPTLASNVRGANFSFPDGLTNGQVLALRAGGAIVELGTEEETE